MNMEREIDEDERREAIDQRRARVRATQCQCGNDLPGHCPGPLFCPYANGEEDESC